MQKSRALTQFEKMSHKFLSEKFNQLEFFFNKQFSSNHLNPNNFPHHALHIPSGSCQQSHKPFIRLRFHDIVSFFRHL